MKIAVGSTNPVKISAVSSVVEKVWPGGHILPLAVASGVSSMPMNEAECLLGARNRAKACLIAAQSDLGIGLEGGVHEGPTGMMLVGWVAALHQDGREGAASTARVLLPRQLVDGVREGQELGDVIDRVLGESDVKMKGGTIGALTAGMVLREDAFAMAVALALSPFISPELYR